jgi:endonuclease/exonuclease/phosphatase family metal-dependent hydrolase
MQRHGLVRTVITFVVAMAIVAPIAARPGTALAAPPGGNNAHRFVSVMTRNLDEGTDFGYITAAANGLMSFANAVAATYGEVLASNVCGRAARVADEIASAQPDLVSLQEAAVWTGPVPAGCAGAASSTTIDAEAALMTGLAADGANYVVVAEQDEFSSSVIAPLLPPGLSFLDRDLLLARVEDPDQLSVTNVTAAHFRTLLPLQLFPGVTIPITRGWISADATLRGRTVRVIATHLESFYEPVQEAQGIELVSGPANTTLPVIIAGDLNTGPGSAHLATYNFLTISAGFTDTWSVTHPGEPGFTDAFYTEDPTTPAVPSERIDLVLVRGNLVPTADVQVGGEIPHPSDHAGIVATIRIPS